MERSMSQNDFDMIEAFLDGRLEEEELQAFEDRRASSETFAELVSELAAIRLGVERAALSQRLDFYHQGIAQKNVTSQIWFWAAAVVVFVSLGLWLVLGQESDGERLFQAYYHPDPGLVTSMSGEGEYEFNRAMVDYKTGDYRTALKSFQSLVKENNTNDTLQYFLAMSELNLGNELAAKEILEALSFAATEDFSKDASWYLGLLELKAGNYGQAIEYLRKSGYPEHVELILQIEGLDSR